MPELCFEQSCHLDRNASQTVVLSRWRHSVPRGAGCLNDRRRRPHPENPSVIFVQSGCDGAQHFSSQRPPNSLYCSLLAPYTETETHTTCPPTLNLWCHLQEGQWPLSGACGVAVGSDNMASHGYTCKLVRGATAEATPVDRCVHWLRDIPGVSLLFLVLAGRGAPCTFSSGSHLRLLAVPLDNPAARRGTDGVQTVRLIGLIHGEARGGRGCPRRCRQNPDYLYKYVQTIGMMSEGLRGGQPNALALDSSEAIIFTLFALITDRRPPLVGHLHTNRCVF